MSVDELLPFLKKPSRYLNLSTRRLGATPTSRDPYLADWPMFVTILFASDARIRE